MTYRTGIRAAVSALAGVAAVAATLTFAPGAAQAGTETQTRAATQAGTQAATTTIIGRSVRGRAIYAYRIGNPLSTRKRVVIGQMHGNERAGYDAARYLVATSRPTTIDLWVVPTVNPDGLAAGTRKNARGVDLNRNFPTAWAAVYPPSSGYYQGPYPRSEPETRAIYDFLWTVRPHEVTSLHQPLYGVDSYALKDRAFHSRLVSATGLPSRWFGCSGVCRGTLRSGTTPTTRAR